MSKCMSKLKLSSLDTCHKHSSGHMCIADILHSHSACQVHTYICWTCNQLYSVCHLCTGYGMMQQAFEVLVAFRVGVCMHVAMAVGYVCVFFAQWLPTCACMLAFLCPMYYCSLVKA